MHSDILYANEHRSRGLHPEFKRRIASLEKPRVLDWGCGRGSDVLHLRGQGIDAYGAEIDPKTIERGKALFSALGIDHARIIKRITDDNRTEFESGQFDAIISYQVLEHVADLPSALREMHRLLRPGGISVHVFPAYRVLVEPHLKMPLVHWLPKNGLRRAAIRLYVTLGVEPKGWPECEGHNARVRTEEYFRFSRDKTFYRAPRVLSRTFREVGLSPSFEARFHPRIRRTPLAWFPGVLLEWALSTFVGSIIVARKL